MDREAIVECRVHSEEDTLGKSVSGRSSSRSHGRVVTRFVHKDKLEVKALPVVLLRVALV